MWRFRILEGVSSREAVVEELEELPTDVGLDTLAKRWIEPQDVAAATLLPVVQKKRRLLEG